MIYKNAKRFCREDISKIKNYAEAMADETQTWDCHHWNEQWFTRQELIKLGRYYDVPADELVFMTRKEHKQWHSKYGAEWEESRRKNSEANKGQIPWNKGKTLSEETKRKLSEAHKGKTRPEETKHKMREALKAYWVRRKSKQA